MSLIPVIIDSPVAYPHIASGTCSLCALPLGSATVLDYLRARLTVFGTPPRILSLTPPPGGVSTPPTCKSNLFATVVYSSGDFPRFLAGCENGDYILLIDPRCWPVAGFSFEAVAGMLRDYRAVTHVVGVHAREECVREVVERAYDGKIRRVQRLYDIVLWPDVASQQIVYSLIPAQAMVQIPFTSLMQLRGVLSGRGVLSRDLPHLSGIIDLAEESSFLSLSELLIAETINDPPDELSATAPGVLVGRRCRIHPSARLVPPIIMQAGVILEAGATVVGPAVLGAESRVRRGATVAQSVLAAHVEVGHEATVLHQVVSGRCSRDMAHQEYLPEPLGGSIGMSKNEVYGVKGINLTNGQTSSRKKAQFFIKRFVDIGLSLIALIVLAPFFMIIALLIKLDSRGPVFFIHRRESRHGKEFSCYKFRTMQDDAHNLQQTLYSMNEVDGPQFKLLNDPRITRIGRWLRLTNSDELPQLFNVLLGQMSLVGPRPSPFRENQICIPWRQARLSVRPGITGLWQICRDGPAHSGFHQWIYYDIIYVRNFSIWLDIKILLATLFSLIGHWPIQVSWLVKKAGRIPVYSS
ncbi:MAG: hypothetical protein GXY44_08480 [Phycisphaerales bacterium]|nr:hypothetical protein [Phycisphaerales bacterium]